MRKRSQEGCLPDSGAFRSTPSLSVFAKKITTNKNFFAFGILLKVGISGQACPYLNNFPGSDFQAFCESPGQHDAQVLFLKNSALPIEMSFEELHVRAIPS